MTPIDKLKQVIEQTPDEVMRFTDETLSDAVRDVSPMLTWMHDTDYFTAPAAKFHHYSHKGGLAQHSLQVGFLALHMAEAHQWYEPSLTEESIMITAICHDFCKVNYYKEVFDSASEAQAKYVKDLFMKGNRPLPELALQNKAYCSDLIGWAKDGFFEDAPKLPTQWVIEEPFPFGHGEKSALIANKLVELTDAELLAIRWHDHEYAVAKDNERTWNQVRSEVPLVLLIANADIQTSMLLESGR